MDIRSWKSFLARRYCLDIKYQGEEYKFSPVLEVSAGTALLYLETNAKTLGINSSTQFYYFTGILSSFLDNTPTAVTFHSLALGLSETGGSIIAGIPEVLMRAICLGAVLFGSMTYIGNGPNFMIKAIAEDNNIKMPDFFSYMFRFSLIVLLPIFILVEIIFV